MTLYPGLSGVWEKHFSRISFHSAGEKLLFFGVYEFLFYSLTFYFEKQKSDLENKQTKKHNIVQTKTTSIIKKRKKNKEITKRNPNTFFWSMVLIFLNNKHIHVGTFTLGTSTLGE